MRKIVKLAINDGLIRMDPFTGYEFITSPLVPKSLTAQELKILIKAIVRRLGGRRMSLSGFIENLARHHLEIYHDDVEVWKKL